MRKRLLPLLVIALARATAVAQPDTSARAPEVAPEATNAVAPRVADARRAYAVRLTMRAVMAARAGDCGAVRTIEVQIHDLDPEYRRRSFEFDPAITHCLPPPTVGQDHEGLMLGAGIGVGTGLTGDLRLGWMLAPQIAVFATGVWSNSVQDAGSDFRLLGGGLRFWLAESVFCDVRVGYAQGHHHEVEPPAMRDPTGAGGMVGLGVEFVRSKTFGLELNAALMKGGESGALAVGMGVAFY